MFGRKAVGMRAAACQALQRVSGLGVWGFRGLGHLGFRRMV